MLIHSVYYTPSYNTRPQLYMYSGENQVTKKVVYSIASKPYTGYLSIENIQYLVSI